MSWYYSVAVLQLERCDHGVKFWKVGCFLARHTKAAGAVPDATVTIETKVKPNMQPSS